MKILHLSGARIWGGNEQQLAYLISALTALDIRNEIFCFKGSPIEAHASNKGVDYYSVNKVKSYSRTLVRQLQECILLGKPDVIHIHTSNLLTTYVICDILNTVEVPIVYSKKGLSDKSSLLSRYKYNYHKIGKIICVSKAVKQSLNAFLTRKNRRKLCLIHDGIPLSETDSDPVENLRNTYRIPKEAKLVGNVANHSQDKDLGTFIRTANYLVHQLGRKDVYFVQLGKELKYTKGFIGLIEDYKLTNRVFFTGFVPAAKNYISQFDVFLLTSKKEGLSVSILDSFKAKVPVVATRVGGIPEVVVDGKTGFLAEVGDADALGAKVETILNDTELAGALTRNASKLLKESFSIEQLVEKTLAVYRSVS